MILNIDKKIENNTLTVEITCHERKFLSHEIKLLTTENVIDIIKKQHKITKTILEPNHKVGNTKRGKTKLSGKWVFELEKEKKTRTKKTTTTTNKPSNSNKIRSRISKLAKEQKEE